VLASKLTGRAAYAALVCAALLHALAYPPIFGPSYSVPAIVAWSIPALVATGLGAWRTRTSSGTDRTGWFVLTLAFGSTAVLDATWGIFTRLGHDPGYPGWMDPPYLASYALFVAGVGLTVSPLWRSEDRRWLFDAGALLAVSAGLMLHFVLPRTSNGPVETATGLAYLLLDLAFLGTVLSGVYRAKITLRNALLMLGGTTLAAGDIAWYFYELAYDSSWTVGVWLMAIAAATPPALQVNFPPLRVARSGAVPYIFVVCIAAITAYEMQTDRADDLLVAGVVALLLVIARQVVALRQALESQRKETAFRDALLEAQSELGLGMVILEHGKIVFANGAAERISGRTAQELMALPAIEALAVERDRDDWRSWLTQPTLPEETRVLRADGSFLDVEVVARRLNGPGESRVLVVARDISARKAQHEAIAHAQKFESLGALAGGVAHDFNNLLSAVLGNVGLLRLGELDEEARETIDSIDAAARRGADLTRSLLDFARPQPPSFRQEDLRECILETASLARSGLPVNVTLHVDPGETPVLVRGNRGQLVQAFLNLILNARDAVGEAGDIYLRLRASDSLASVEVRDNGTGMDERTQQRIFEPFFTTKTAGAGTGLGLAICQRTIRDHRGNMSVESAPGEGTTFTVTLPLAALAPVG